jgi:hypothetical protein
MQALHDGLAARRRQLLPARQQVLPDVALLLRSHLLPHLLAFAQVLLLSGSEAVPGFEALANLSLLLWRQILEALIVLQEFFLPVRRHILETLDRLRGQLVCVWSKTVWARRVSTGSVWDELLLPLLAPELALRTALCGSLGSRLTDRNVSLSERWSARQDFYRQHRNYSAELETQSHF